MKAFLEELRTQHIYRIAAGYMVSSWLILQIASLLCSALGLPSWTLKAILALLLVGFGAALIIAWRIDLRAARLAAGDSSLRSRKVHFVLWPAVAILIVSGSTLMVSAFLDANQASKMLGLEVRSSVPAVESGMPIPVRQASWASFNQAERQFQLGEWKEAIALLARAIKFDPANQVASERFFQELVIHREKALPRLIASLDHQDAIYALAFSPDGARILTASWDKTAKLWDAFSGKLIATFAHQGAINAAVFSPDGARILTASADKTAKLWDAVSGKLIASFPHNGSVNAAAFSPDGARILTASADKTAKLWDATSGKLIAIFDHQDAVYHAAFSPDGTRILTASADRSAKLWDSVSGKLVASLDHQDEVNDAAFSPDGSRILTACLDKTARLWDASSAKLMVSFVHQASVCRGAFSPDGARILTASADNTAKLWDAASGKLIAAFDHQGAVRWSTFSPEGGRVLTASWDKTAKLWDVATPATLARGKAAGTDSSGAITGYAAPEVESLSIVASGFKFADDGSLVTVDEQIRSQITAQLESLAKKHGPNARFARWFCSTGNDRTIFPASDVKVVEWVENALLTNPNVSEQWVRNALVFLPDHPLLHIALAGFENDSLRADFLRSFGLARLPRKSAVCTRAAELLLAQQRPVLALSAVDNALLADPKDLSAQHLRVKVLDAIPR